MRRNGSATESSEFLEELACRARDVNPARDAAFAVFHPLNNARGLAALGTIRALGGVHDLLAVRCLCDLGAYCHEESPDVSNMCAALRVSPAEECGWSCLDPLGKNLKLRLGALPPNFILT